MSGAALARARAAWTDLPDWVEALALACDQASQRAVAERLGYSASTVNYVLSRRYAGDLKGVEQAVRGALMAAEVLCPVVGALAADACAEHQRRPWSSVNPGRLAMWKACRSGCPHSRLAAEEGP